VTNLIKKDLNISLSIQFYFAEVFVLDHIYTISIDNAFLEITYRILPVPESDNDFTKMMIIITALSTIFITALLISLLIIKPRIQRHSQIKNDTRKAKKEIENFKHDLGNLIKNKLVNYFEVENWEKGIPLVIMNEIQKKAKKDRKKRKIDPIKILNIDQLTTIVLDENNWKNIFSEIFVERHVIEEKFNNLKIYKNELYQGILDPGELDKHTILIQAIRNYFIEGMNIFFSYSPLDTTYYRIAEVAHLLEKYSEIEKVFYWKVESGKNIVKFKEQSMQISKVFVLFCSVNSLKSKAVEDEWQAAFQLRKKRTLKMIPVYENEAEIPLLLGHILYIKFNKDDLEGFVEELYKEILRGV
jgi:hypothetical protein